MNFKMNFNMAGQIAFRLLHRSLIAGAVILCSQIVSSPSLPIAINHELAVRVLMPAAMAKTAASSQANNEKPAVTEETINGKCFCVSHILVKARPDQVWKVLCDYKHAVHIFPLLKKCEVLEIMAAQK